MSIIFKNLSKSFLNIQMKKFLVLLIEFLMLLFDANKCLWFWSKPSAFDNPTIKIKRR